MTILSDLTLQARVLIASCRNVFGADWSADAATSMHQQVETLSEIAANAGDATLADSLFELSVFLCSVVDEQSPPSPVVQTRIAAMCDVIFPSAEPTSHRGKVEISSDANAVSRVPLVILLTDAGSSDGSLLTAVAARNLAVCQVDSLTALSVEVSRRPVAVVAMSDAWANSAAEVVAVIERAHPQSFTQPGTLAQIELGDRAKRMFALRAGIDRVVESATSDSLADAIASFVAKRVKSAFRVLIVEDDRSQAMFAEKVLGHRGMLTMVATSAAEALAVVDQFNPELCLLDLNLPDRNGIELAQLLRDKPGFEFVQIVFLTGELNPDARTLAVRLGADDWIVKPVRPRDLLAVVETRAERARRSLLHDSTGKLGREAARGVQARRRMLTAITNLGGGESAAQSVLVAVAPMIGAESIEVSWLDQAELGGEIALALRAHGLVRSEVCQAETLLSLFIVDPAVGNQQSLASISGDLESRRWLSSGDGVQFPFAVVGVQLDGTLTADEAVEAAQSLLRKAQESAPRVRFQASSITAAQPPGWPQLRDMFANDALGRSQRITFLPIVPLEGSLGGQFWLRESFELRLADGEACVPDHRAFARRNGFHLRLDEWLIARCFDRLRMARGELSLVAEICPETIEDPTFALWVQAECQRRRLVSPKLTLMVSPERMRNASARGESALRPLIAEGLKIALGPLSDSANDLRLARMEEVHMIVCQPPTEGPPVPVDLLKLAQDHQKQILVIGVNDASMAESVFRQPVHFVSGDSISPPLSRPEFEFPV